MAGLVRVEGLRDLQRAFKIADAAESKGLRRTLREVAEPVKLDAERLAVDTIPRIGFPWSRMRVGVTQTSVYIAPRERGKRSRGNPALRRPNLKGLLLDRAMEPALQQDTPLVVAAVDRMLATVGRQWEEV